MVFSNELPSCAELAAIYAADFFKIGAKFSGDSQGADAINARQRVSKVRALPGVGTDKWLDVGCATGGFMLAARSQVRQVYGNDLSDYAVAQARSRGLTTAVTGDFMELDCPSGTFDLVSMWDVIEHVCDPMANLKKVFNILRPSGYVVLTTGDVESWPARLMGRCWHLMVPPIHLYFFSARTILRMLSHIGFESISIEYSGKRVPLDFLVWKFASRVSVSLAKIILRMLKPLNTGKLALEVNLHDIMMVSARKPA
jgi:ubiquinone/menaquinone biosynthesis C-methylase UbiE